MTGHKSLKKMGDCVGEATAPQIARYCAFLSLKYWR
jgi:hypothetical protein